MVRAAVQGRPPVERSNRAGDLGVAAVVGTGCEDALHPEPLPVWWGLLRVPGSAEDASWIWGADDLRSSYRSGRDCGQCADRHQPGEAGAGAAEPLLDPEHDRAQPAGRERWR